GVLIGNQPHGNFGRSFRGNNGLRAGSGKAARHPVNFERGTRPGAIESGKSRFTSESVGTYFGFAEVLLIEGELFPGLQLRSTRRFHLRIEARDQYAAFRVFEFADDFDQAEKRVGGNTSVHAGVEISPGTNRLDFGINQASQAHAQSWQIGGKEFGIADQSEVGLKSGFFFSNELRDRFSADFLFAFN